MLDEEAIKIIEKIISESKTAEVTIRNGKIIIWELRSKKKYESPLQHGNG